MRPPPVTLSPSRANSLSSNGNLLCSLSLIHFPGIRIFLRKSQVSPLKNGWPKTCFPIEAQERCLQLLPKGRKKPEQNKDRKSTRLNSSHVRISYAVFCLKKK